MPFKISRLWIAFLLAFAIGGVVVSALVFGPSIRGSNAPKIGIVYTAPSPVINDIISGFKAKVLESYPNAQFFERHANGRQEERGTAVLAVIGAKPDLLAPITTPITQITVAQARGATPIVFMGVTDPVGAGVAKSIERPEIATGSSDLCPFSALLSVVRQTLPQARVLGLPYNPTDEPAVFGLKELQRLAPAQGFKIVPRQVTSVDELGTQVNGLASRVDAVLISSDNMMIENPAVVVKAAQTLGKPTFACDDASVDAGALAGVSVDYRQVGELAGARAVQVLRGQKSGDIPVGVLNSGGVYINHKAACLDRVEIPKAVAASAKVVSADYQCVAARN